MLKNNFLLEVICLERRCRAALWSSGDQAKIPPDFTSWIPASLTKMMQNDIHSQSFPEVHGLACMGQSRAEYLLLQLKTCLVMVQGIQSQSVAIWWVNAQCSQELKYLLFHHDISCVKCWRKKKKNTKQKRLYNSTVVFWISLSSAVWLVASGRKKTERTQPIDGRWEEKYPNLQMLDLNSSM